MASDDQKLQEAKEKLQKPLESLETISSSLASFTLQWKDLELFFKSIQNSIETLESEPDQTENPIQLSTSFKTQYDWFVDPRPVTKQFCMDMDGKGLIFYLIENPKYRKGLASALLFAPDPALLVLDALLGCFYPNDGEVDMRFLKTCVRLLEELMKVSSLSIRSEVMDEARKLAMQWKEKISSSDNCYLEILGMLLLLAVFRLGSEFNRNGELIDLFQIIIDKRYHKAFELCMILGLEDRVSAFVGDLIRKREYIEAINAIYKFRLVDMFPVFKLLRKKLWDGKKAAKEICKKETYSLESRYEAIDSQIAIVIDVLRCVENHKIECKYDSSNLRMRIRKLKLEKKDLRRNAETCAIASQWQHQGGNKRHPSLAGDGPLEKIKRQCLPAEAAPENAKRQLLAAEGASKNVEHQMLAAEGAPKNVKHQMLAAEGSPKNVEHQMLAAEGAPKNAEHQILAAEGAPKNVEHQMLAAEAAPKNVASVPHVVHQFQQPKSDEMGACTSEDSQYLNSEAGSYGLTGFASATNTYSSSSGGQFGFNGISAGSGATMNPGNFQLAETRTSTGVSGLAGMLFNKKKKKIVGLVGSVGRISNHGTTASQ